MWYLEHFNYAGLLDKPVRRKSSFSSIIHNGDIVPEITIDVQHHYDSTDLLKHISIPDDLKITSLYGKSGMTLADVMSDTRENIILEMPAIWLSLIPDVELRHIVSTRHLLLTDFEDGGMIYNNHLVKRLIRLRQIPAKTIIYATSSTKLNDLPSLNVKQLHVPNWLFCCSSHAYSRHKHNVDEYVHRIQQSTYPKQALFLNFKPRLYRAKALLKLWEHDILDHQKFDWSLIDGLPPVFSHTVEQGHQEEIFDSLTTDVQSKLTPYEQEKWQRFRQHYPTPRLHSSMNNMDEIVASSDSDFAVYNWNLAVETHYGNEFPLLHGLGSASFLTEKTFKSFMQASMPITLCEGDTYSYLNKLGFRVDNQYLDCYNDPEDRLNETVKLIQNIISNHITPDKQDLIHNFEQIVDIRNAAHHFSICLINILKLLAHSK